MSKEIEKLKRELNNIAQANLNFIETKDELVAFGKLEEILRLFKEYRFNKNADMIYGQECAQWMFILKFKEQ